MQIDDACAAAHGRPSSPLDVNEGRHLRLPIEPGKIVDEIVVDAAGSQTRRLMPELSFQPRGDRVKTDSLRRPLPRDLHRRVAAVGQIECPARAERRGNRSAASPKMVLQTAFCQEVRAVCLCRKASSADVCQPRVPTRQKST